ncbi:MAG: AraC family transcriptional regulator ligand-binding domain-containing protein, partial [Pseudomonadota bacterium]
MVESIRLADTHHPVDEDVLHPLYCAILLEIAREKGIPTDALCDMKQRKRIESRHPPKVFAAILCNILQRQPGFAATSFSFGRYLDIASAGLIGQAVISAPTVGKALFFICRYYPLTGLYLNLEHAQQGDELIVTFDLDYPNMPGQVRTYLVEALVNSWSQALKALCDHSLPLKRAGFAFEQPQHRDIYAQQFASADIAFDCQQNFLVVDYALLNKATNTHNAAVHRRAVARCDTLLLEKGAQPRTADLVRKHIRLLKDMNDANPEHIALSLNLSTRTLNRRLRDEGLCFKSLFDEVRLQRAQNLLEN